MIRRVDSHQVDFHLVRLPYLESGGFGLDGSKKVCFAKLAERDDFAVLAFAYSCLIDAFVHMLIV